MLPSMTEIIDISDVTIDISTQCVVVGAGACGLVAALKLAGQGIETPVSYTHLTLPTKA